MNGYQINFYTLQNRKYQDQPIAEWLLEKAQDHGHPSATPLFTPMKALVATAVFMPHVS